jgi:hypothetical protein
MFIKLKSRLKIFAALVVVGTPLLLVQPALAITPCGDKASGTQYTPSIDLGCQGKGNSILDLMFAAIRFLSIGVGLVIVASLVYAGIQYIGSRGDPNANALAVKRINSNVTALLIYIFAFAILNYVIPGQFLK